MLRNLEMICIPSYEYKFTHTEIPTHRGWKRVKRSSRTQPEHLYLLWRNKIWELHFCDHLNFWISDQVQTGRAVPVLKLEILLEVSSMHREELDPQHVDARKPWFVLLEGESRKTKKIRGIVQRDCGIILLAFSRLVTWSRSKPYPFDPGLNICRQNLQSDIWFIGTLLLSKMRKCNLFANSSSRIGISFLQHGFSFWKPTFTEIDFRSGGTLHSFVSCPEMK